jgi:hypothetical protein
MGLPPPGVLRIALRSRAILTDMLCVLAPVAVESHDFDTVVDQLEVG